MLHPSFSPLDCLQQPSPKFVRLGHAGCPGHAPNSFVLQQRTKTSAERRPLPSPPSTAPPSLPVADPPRCAGRSPSRARLTVIVRGLASPRRRLNPTRLVLRFRVPDSRGSSATSPAARPCSGRLMQHPHGKDDREHAVAASLDEAVAGRVAPIWVEEREGRIFAFSLDSDANCVSGLGTLLASDFFIG